MSLPNLLDYATMESDVFDFTRNNGWQKTNNLLPLLYHQGRWKFHDLFDAWITPLARFTGNLKVSDFPLH